MFRGDLMGVQVVEDPTLVEPVGEDWSRVRSPGRARRRRSPVSPRGRRKRAHWQQIRTIYRAKEEVFMIDGPPAMIVCHPTIADRLRAYVAYGE